MKHRFAASLLTAGLLAAATSGAHAAAFTRIDPADSRITFQYSQMGVSLDGAFQQFSGELNFDPQQPDQGKAVLDVNLASVDAGADEANDELAKPEWFNSPAFPTARFESKAIRALGDNRFDVDGTLTIKGKSQPVTVPVAFTPSGDNAGTFSGTITIQRNAFTIGEGAWSKTDIVADDVKVEFHLSASR